jgi:cellulose synthase/poly-beta-1,6-N-acetylglucosamine synthase-like glycosyltransferase
MNNTTIEVSIVTPTYNRRKFIPILIEIYKNQTFPKEKMEWIIIDDGKDCVEDLFKEASKTIPNIRYQYLDEKVRIGAKRNLLNKEAKGGIIIAMDDDDYYPKDRVQMIVNAFKKYPKVDLAGASEMNLYYTDTTKVFTIGPHHPNHATNGTMAWRKKYSDIHKYDEYVTSAEELSFLDNYKYPMIQLDPKKSILVICHTDNTVDKMALREEHLSDPLEGKSKMRETQYQLKDLVKESSIRKFYSDL